MSKRLAAYGLVVLGLAQMAADAWGVRAIKGAAAATAAAPAPRVFGSLRGFETFSQRMAVERRAGGGSRIVEIDRALYGRLEGPYNRRNVYGAAISYGPVLAPELRDPVLRRALCEGAESIRVEYRARKDGAVRSVEVSCR